jgi:hypothetical protein
LFLAFFGSFTAKENKDIVAILLEMTSGKTRNQ